MQIKHLVAATIALKGLGSLLFIFGSSFGAYLLVSKLNLASLPAVFLYLYMCVYIFYFTCWSTYTELCFIILFAASASGYCFAHIVWLLQLRRWKERIRSTFLQVYAGEQSRKPLFHCIFLVRWFNFGRSFYWT